MKYKKWNICPHCGSKNSQCIGGGDYKKTGEGMGHEIRLMVYQCKDCNKTWQE